MEIADEPFRDALLGVEEFGHQQVIWWFNQFDQPAMRQVLTCEQPYRTAPDRLGVFATRSPVRPTWCAHWPQWYEDSGAFDWAGEFVVRDLF